MGTEDDRTIQGGGDRARTHLQRLLNTGEIDGHTITIDPAYDIHWDDPYETLFSIPDGNPKYAVLHAGINVDDWLAIQHDLHGGGSWTAFKNSAYQPTVDSVAADIQAGDTDDIPTPVLEIKPDYSLDYDEGRSRGFGAKKAGLTMMPIWIAAQEYR